METSTRAATSPMTPPPPPGLVWVIARKELLDHLLSLKFHVCFVAMAFLLGLSAFVMYRDYLLRMENYAVLRERAKPRPGESGLLAVVEPRRLSVFAKGLDEVMGRGYSVTAYDGIMPHDFPTPLARLFCLFAPPDFLYLVKALLSLIALLFAYDAVSGERERGTLKLVLSSAVSRGELAAGKMLGGLAAVILPFLAAFFATLFALSTRPNLALGADEFARLSLIVLAAFLYALLFFSLGVLVSALSRSSSASLIILLFVWATIVFAAPSVGSLVAERISPPPSARTEEALRRQAFVKSRFLAIHEQHSREASFEGFNEEYDRLVEAHRAKLDATLRLSQSLARISPAAALTFVFTDLAGTGLAEQRRLARELLSFKNRNLRPMMEVNKLYVPAFTTFEFAPMRLDDVLQKGALIDFAILALGCGMLFTSALLVVLKVDVR